MSLLATSLGFNELFVEPQIRLEIIYSLMPNYGIGTLIGQVLWRVHLVTLHV